MRLPIGVSVVLLCVGCANGADYGGGGAGGYSADGGSSRSCYGANDCAPGYECNPFGVCIPLQSGGNGVVGGADMGTPLPPEVQKKTEPPASGKRYVYVAVAAEDTVVKIDSTNLAVQTISVGHDPGPLRTAPGRDVAVVLNKQSNTVSLLRARDDGGDDIVTLPTAAGLNSLTMSPDGRYALAWFDLNASGGTLAPKQSFQEVTLIALEAGKEQAVRLAVGFRPSEVQWRPDGQAAWIVTDQGLSVIPLAQTPAPGVVQTVPLVKDPLMEQPPTLVRVAPDGKRVLALPPLLQGVRAVDLGSGAITDVKLDAAPTDIEVTPAGDLALAVLRDAKELAVLHLPADLADPSGITKLSTGDYVAGQAALTADGKHALLFTNAIAQKVMLVADLAAPQAIRTLPLEKAVRDVRIAPVGNAAIIIHNKAPGTPSPQDTLDQYLDKLQAYSLFDVESGYAKLQPTDAEPGATAFADDGGSAYLLLRDDGASVRSVEALDLHTFLVNSVPLGSPPVAVGVVPQTAQVYVAQEHPLGRMTFVDTGTFQTRTLTGFGLNGGVIE